jgi:sugar lactone lactonase YvrE
MHFERLFVLAVLFLAFITRSPARADETTLADVHYPEGPEWRDGTLLFAEMGRDQVTTFDGTRSSAFWRERGCGPTAIAPYRGSDLVILCHLGGYLAQVDASGATIGRFKRDGSGKRLRDPNDASPDDKGGIYFSDAGTFRKGAPSTGSILYLDQEGRIERVASDLSYANGVYFDAKHHRLFVSEHLARRVLVFDVRQDGRLGAGRVFFDLDRDGPALRTAYAESGPDGLALDETGVLWVCEYGQSRLLAIDEKGRILGQLLFSTPYLTNIAINRDGLVAVTGAHTNASPPFRGEVRLLSLATMRQAIVPSPRAR